MKLSDLTVIYNYKEPLTKVTSGFGYFGCLSGTQEQDKLQCHICGELFKDLGMHVVYKHQVERHDYKERFGLARLTKLISPTYKDEKREAFLKAFDEKKRQKMSKKGHDKALQTPSKGGVKISLETMNKRGSCPDQIIAKILETEKKLGHVPSLVEFQREDFGQRYWALIKRTFKTWNNVLKVARLKKIHSPSRFVTHRYHPEELLEYISIFKQEEGRIPRYSDFSNGMLPAYTTYKSHFGTLEKARQLAHI